MSTGVCRGRGLAGVLLVVASLAAGCGQEIEITQYPPFFDPDDPTKNIKTIVVLPFRNQAARAGSARAGEGVGEELAGLLGGTGTYMKVYNHNDLSALMDQQDLLIAGGGDPNALAGALRKRGAVEALITGAVTAYDSSSRTRTEMRQQMVGIDPRTKAPIYRPVMMQITTNEGTVTVAATLTRIRDGAPIHATGPVYGRYRSEGQSGVTSEPECLRLATSQAVFGTNEHFAVVRKTVTVDSDAFRVASAYYDGEWSEADEFTPADTQAFVVLKLPPVCDRNRFRITIVREDRQEDLFVQKVRWLKKSQPAHPGSAMQVDPGKIGIGFAFNPSEIAKKGGGPGTYVAKFYAGAKPALAVEFDIEAP